MMNKRTTHAARGLLALGLAGLAPLAAQAQAAADPWKGEVGIYGWFPALGGSTSFPSGGGGSSIDVTASDVIDALKMTFMGEAELRKGRWGGWTDIVYADLGASKDGTRDFTIGHHPVGVNANLSLDLKATVWTLAGLYNLDTTPDYTVDVIAGARMLDLKQTLNWSLATSIPELPGRSGEASVSGTDWDAIVGVKGRYYFGAERKWFIPYYLDMGAGQSKFTWQINAGVGYKFDWGSLFATWRYLDYDFKSGNAVDSLSMNGGLIGVAFQF